MKLPGGENAYVPSRKLTEYLLSETHPAGSSKALFLRSVGFNDANVRLLRQKLVAIACSEDVKEYVPSSYGTKYVIEEVLTAPTGRFVQVRTIWIIEPTDDRPRFVTAYPM